MTAVNNLDNKDHILASLEFFYIDMQICSKKTSAINRVEKK